VQIARGLIIVCSALLFMTALKYLPLADATALNYSSPVLVIMLAVAFLGERMTRVRVVFVVAGIVGMLLIVRPGTEMRTMVLLQTVPVGPKDDRLVAPPQAGQRGQL